MRSKWVCAVLISFICNSSADDIPEYTNCSYSGYENWITFDNKICYLIPDFKHYLTGTWHDSDRTCRSLGGQLVSIHDSQTNDMLSNIISKITTFSYNVKIVNLWIGLNSLNKRGYYVWSDGTVRQYTNFPPRNGELPDIVPTIAQQDIYYEGRCVHMQVLNIKNNQTFGFWYYEECNTELMIICEKNVAQPINSTPPPVVNGSCEAGWYNYAGEKCVQILERQMTFTQAKARCHALEGDLLSIHSREEQNFITTIIADKSWLPYIGVYRKSYYTRWLWDDQSDMQFANWAIQELDDNDDGQSCGVIVTNELQAGKWLIVSCDANHTAICQKSINPRITTPASQVYANCTIPGYGVSDQSYYKYRNSCYSFVDDPADHRSWDSAEEWCEEQGAHLVSINDPFEYAFIMYHILYNTISDQFWIGLYADTNGVQNSSVVFEWTDKWPNYYTNWAQNEPPFNYADDKTCVYQSKSNGTWRTAADCLTNRAFICKVTENQLPALNERIEAVCPKFNNTNDNYLWRDLDKRSKYCYWFSVDADDFGGLMSWTDATFHCQQRKGSLASVHSYHDLLLFKNKIINVVQPFDTWIGLYQSPDGEYIWSDGSAIDYTNWDTDYEKQEKLNSFGDNCVRVLMSNLTWRKSKCVNNIRGQNYFICEIEKISLLSEQTDPKIWNKISLGAGIGISIAVLIVTAFVIMGAVCLIKKCKLSDPSFPSFENSLYSSRRNANSRSIDAYNPPKHSNNAPKAPPRSRK